MRRKIASLVVAFLCAASAPALAQQGQPATVAPVVVVEAPAVPPPGGAVVVQAPVVAPPPAGVVMVQAPMMAPAPRVMTYGAMPFGPRRLRANEALPPGYALETRPRLGLVIGGAATFGVMYALMIPLMATPGYAITAIPVIGPFISGGAILSGGASATSGCSTGLSCLGAGFVGALGIIVGISVIGDGILQLGGVVMFGVGMGLRERWAVPQAQPRAQQRNRWFLTPGAAGAPLGMSFSMVHF